MQIAELVLEYLKTLAWPVVVLIIACKVLPHITRLLKRITEEAQEVSAMYKDLTIQAQFTKLATASRAKSGDIDKALERNDVQEARRLAQQSITEADQAMLQGFKQLGELLPVKPSFKDRVALERALHTIASNLSLDDLYKLARSSSDAERAVAAASLCVKLREDTEHVPELINTLHQLLKDTASIVKFYAILASHSLPDDAIDGVLWDQVLDLHLHDPDEGVRRVARQFLEAKEH